MLGLKKINAYSLLLSLLLLTNSPFAVAADVASCPAANTVRSSPSEAYVAGFNTGCDTGLTIDFYTTDSVGNERRMDQTDFCAGNQAPPQYRSPASINQQWVDGCFDGYDTGAAAYQHNFQLWPATPKPQSYNICLSMPGLQRLSTPEYKWQFFNACLISYRKAINNPRVSLEAPIQDFNLTENLNACAAQYGRSINEENGCLAGYGRAVEDFENAFPALPAPDASTYSSAERLRFCNQPTIPTGDTVNGSIIGCVKGFDDGFTDAPKNSGGVSYDVRSTKQVAYHQGYVAGYNAGYDIGVAQHGRCQSQGTTDYSGVPCTAVSGGALVPRCNPALPPSDPNGCGINQFIQLIKNIMRYIFFIAVPVAVLALAWGGFKIMTSAGNTGKVEEGKQSITVAITGIVIMLVSYLVIRIIFVALGVDSAIINSVF